VFVLVVAATPASAIPSVHLVKDIEPGSRGANPYDLIAVGDTLYFVADDGVHGAELWKSDGTGAGTRMVTDIRPGPKGASIGYQPHAIAAVGDIVYFGADDGTHGEELWKSDGTEAGTVMVKDIVSGDGSPWSNPYVMDLLTAVGDTLYFVADDGTHGVRLWKSDGTEIGTEIVSVDGPSWPFELTDVAGILFFLGSDEIHGTELWKSDGTAIGTVLVKDIWPGEGSAGKKYDPGYDDDDLTEVGGTLYFYASDPAHGKELWRSDGTEAGTVTVKDIVRGPGGSGIYGLVDVGGTLYFGASEAHRRELWRSDGTETGTVTVKDLVPGRGWATAYELTDVEGTLYFTIGSELWKSDGTEAGTIAVKDVGGWILDLVSVESTLYFSVDDDTYGEELWQSDGTRTGTQMVTDLRPGPNGSMPAWLTAFDGSLFFRATKPLTGSELWTAAVG
jgi:ELWxxDGT repeat protein